MRAGAQPSPHATERGLAVAVGARSRDGHRQATYQDVVDAPPHKIAEIMHGRLYLSALLAPLPASVRTRLCATLGARFDLDRKRPDRWRIMHWPEAHFGGSPGKDVLVPDIAGWRRARTPTLPDNYFTIAPDWVCEVLSPSTRKLDLGEKRDIYAREGIPHLWLVDPLAKSLETFALEASKWRPLARLSGDADVCQPPFEAIRFPLNDLWDT